MTRINFNQVSLGLVLGFAAFALFSLSDASAKVIKGALPPFETAFFGAVFGLVILPFLQRRGDRWTAVFETPRTSLWLLRFFAYPIGVMGSVTAFTHLSMAEAFVLMFLQPTYVTVMSVLFLKERVGLRRWAAVALGLLGVVIALHPGFRALSMGHLGAVLAGLGGAVSVVTFRAADPREKKVSLFGAGVLGGIVICFVAMLPHYRTPDGEELLLLASYGLLAALANLVLMRATELAPAAWVGPTQYSQMIWAIVLGYLLFGDRIDAPTLIGVALIIGSGILTLHRERVRAAPLPPAIAASTPHVGATMLPKNGGGTMPDRPAARIRQLSDAPEQLGT
ncbi:DMT family transporter [Shinella sp.]|uniref:DMT family transporter n=1 Tax=Shinella sp. TaxID=1870904 RepID=UPI002896CBFD|nr:DMT family transporter [Shinella sp.]